MKLYGKLAWFWEMSRLDDYRVETEFVKKIIKRFKRTKGNSLLDVGCGAGHHHGFLKEYEITGVDASSKMLDIAKRNNPNVKYEIGRMQVFYLERRFDAVIAMDCIAYNLDLPNLRRTIHNLNEHLKRGGVLIFSLDEVRESFKQNETKVRRRSKDRTKVVLIENSFDPDKNDTRYDLTLVFLIRKDGELTVEIDKHKLGLFSLNEMKDVVAGSGLKSHLYDSDFSGREYSGKGPVFVCEKIK